MSQENKKTRESWDTEETRYMLRLVREKQVMRSLDGKRFRAEDIFSCLEEPMHDRGYLKSAKQMQCRFKTLRFQFNQYKRKLSVSGEGNSRKYFPFFSEMNILLADRPVAVMDGVDSEDPAQNEDEIENSCSGTESTSQEHQGMSDLENASSSYAPDEALDEVTDYEEVAGGRETVNQRKRARGQTSYKQCLQNYAQATKENATELQNKLLDKQQQFIGALFEQQREFERDMLTSLVNSQRETMLEVTNSLLNGVKNMFQMPSYYSPSNSMAGPLYNNFTPASSSSGSPSSPSSIPK